MASFNRLLPRICLILLPALLIIVVPGQLHAKKRPGHDRLTDALELLYEARKSNNPIPSLTKARDIIDGTLMPDQPIQHKNAVNSINRAIDGSLHQARNEKDRLEHAIEALRTLMGQKAKK